MWTSNRVGRSRLPALAGFLALTSAVAAARPMPSGALTIAPPLHDYGPIVKHATGTVFVFTVTLPPGGSPTDSVVAKVTGPDAGDFRVSQQMTLPLASAARPYTTCTSSTWRTGGCTVGVEFVPQGLGVRNATLDVSDTRGNRGTAALKGTGIFGCQPVVVSCNYAANYSGTFSWSSVVNIKQGAAPGPHHDGEQSYGVTVQVVNGVATCAGSSSDSTMDYEGSRLDRSKKSSGVVSGPGLVAIEFMQENGQLMYEITASCPSAHVSETYIDHRSNETSTTTLNAKPADWRDRIAMDRQPASALGIDLVGALTIRNPDEDPSNGVTGTMTFTWSLKRT